MTPIEEWEALRAEVERRLTEAEGAVVDWERVSFDGRPLVGADGRWLPIVGFVANTHPTFMIAVHREALKRLNRHRPVVHNVDEFPWALDLCPTCSSRPPWPCPEVAGLRFYLAREGEDR